MTTVEASGRAIDEAIERALQQLGAARDAVRVEVVQEPKPALLGFGGREAIVRVSRRPTIPQIAEEFVTTALGLMGYEVATHTAAADEGWTVTFEGRDVSNLVRRHGPVLDALEVLLALHLYRQAGERVPVVVDAAGYRARREKALQEQAADAAARAVAGGIPVALDPMEARDRRTVHLALRDDPRVETASEGEGHHRHVVVVPRKDDAGGRERASVT
ncbi:MAG: RNA-binding cell elongation regulator Jag/EloR [Armatimonadota bacterium]|nr:RNA-binding cell elongation regulator Jag/EloR [Armatimonadota bacterium]